MKQQYIKQVSKMLLLPRSKKKEVLCDLEEIFSSAQEFGETEEQVIGRLGSPKEFVAGVEEQIGINYLEKQKRKTVIKFVLMTAVAVVSLAIFGIVHITRFPQDAIGQSDAMTTINIEGLLGFDITIILLMVGVVAIVIAGITAIKIFANSRRKS